MLSRISPLVSMDVEDHWSGNIDVADILGKNNQVDIASYGYKLSAVWQHLIFVKLY